MPPHTDVDEEAEASSPEDWQPLTPLVHQRPCEARAASLLREPDPALAVRRRSLVRWSFLAAGALALTAVAATAGTERPSGNAPSVRKVRALKRTVQLELNIKVLHGADAQVLIPIENFNYTEVFPPEHSRAGRLSHHHRTVTLAGFSRPELNARYTERFGLEWVVNERETYWTVDLKYFIYWCTWSQEWIIGWNYTSVHDGNQCDFTAKAPVGIDVLNPTRPRGWSEYKGGQLVDAPRAGVDIISSQEWLDGFGGLTASHDVLDVHPECKRPPYQGIDFTKVYSGMLTHREQMTSNTDYDQGTCNNCWAITVAELVARLLCITSGRQFAGPRALVSPAYITSCAAPALVNPLDGCLGGGAPLEALWWIGEHGIPTGGNFYSDQTCVPFFKANRTAPTHAPPCPTTCTRVGYPRSLQEDLFIPSDLKYTYQTTALESALKALRWGPIAIIIPLYEDFYNYTGGTYKHKSGKRVGNHVMVAHGFEKDYINGFNSWGIGWGYYGSFRVPLDFPIAFIIPGQLVGHGPGYPYPFPSSIEHLRMDGFDQPELNGNYDLWIHELSAVNSHATFWKGDDLMLYWCRSSMFWAITTVSLFDSEEHEWSDEFTENITSEVYKVRARLATRCEWLAHGPQLVEYTALPFMPEAYLTGWYERAGDDSGPGVAKPDAGIVERS